MPHHNPVMVKSDQIPEEKKVLEVSIGPQGNKPEAEWWMLQGAEFMVVVIARVLPHQVERDISSSQELK